MSTHHAVPESYSRREMGALRTGKLPVSLPHISYTLTYAAHVFSCSYRWELLHLAGAVVILGKSGKDVT
jgi:hypothetical protein